VAATTTVPNASLDALTIRVDAIDGQLSDSATKATLASESAAYAATTMSAAAAATLTNMSSVAFDSGSPQCDALPAIPLPFETAIVRLAFEYMRHARGCTMCELLFPVEADSEVDAEADKDANASYEERGIGSSNSGSLDWAETANAPLLSSKPASAAASTAAAAATAVLRRASHCMCWALPCDFARPPAAAATALPPASSSSSDLDTADVAAATSDASCVWWRPAVALQLCADYLDLPGLARIAAQRLADALAIGMALQHLRHCGLLYWVPTRACCISMPSSNLDMSQRVSGGNFGFI
jgi:hypothetical protein